MRPACHRVARRGTILAEILINRSVFGQVRRNPETDTDSANYPDAMQNASIDADRIALPRRIVDAVHRKHRL
jgi:hypothetical protein